MTDDDREDDLAALTKQLINATNEVERQRQLHEAVGGAMGLNPLMQIFEDVISAGERFVARYGEDARATAIIDEARNTQARLAEIFRIRP